MNVDVVSETGLTGLFQQPKQRSPFVSAGSAPDDNDEATMWFLHREMQKVVPVEGHEYENTPVCEPENGFVGGIARTGFAQQRDIVAELLEQIAQVVGDVMIKQEADAICLATSKSISPRWSS